MWDRDQFNESDSDSDIQQLPSQQKIEFSVLKHIPAARKILEGQNRAYQIYSPRCLYSEQLTRTNRYIMPKPEQNNKILGSRLISIQDALFEHTKMKEKIMDLYNKHQRESTNTLWDIYNQRDLYYTRFQQTPKKQNFAGIFMNVVGINLSKNRGSNNFPQIKPKTAVAPIKNNNGGLIFDSHFESGNLLYVYKNNDERNSLETYDLILQNDVNTRGHNQWFYFKITNTKKNQKVKINIINLVKKQSLFSYGLKPLTFSQKNNKNGVTWIRNGHKICYQQNSIKRQHKNQPFYTLSFQYQFREAYDTVYFAPSYPYSYSQLLYFMDSLLTDKRYTDFLSIKKLCESVGRNTINLISISTGKQIIKDSKIIWILARQHPVQTTSSFMVEGIIKYLLNLMLKSCQEGNSFYDNYIFKIVPMLNPDGVIHGNTRAELTGIDPNRVWKKTSKTVTPAVHYIKKQIIKTKQQTCLVLDLHSHSQKLGCFFYGNYDGCEVKKFRLLPSTVCQNDVRFCYKNSRFRGGNQHSARRTLFRELSIPNIFTVECSLLGYVKDNRINQYKVGDYMEMGVKILQSFFEIQKQDGILSLQASQYPNQSTDFCDAQSARSDSCVSDEQYQQVYSFGRIKKRAQPKKLKPKSNTNIYNHKHHVSQHPNTRKVQSSSSKFKEQLKSEQTINNQQYEEQTLQKTTTINLKQPSKQSRLECTRQYSIKLKSRIAKNIRLNTKKKYCRSIKQQISTENATNKVYHQKSIQVEQLKNSNQNIDPAARLKTEKKLIVVGSSVEQQKIFIGRNEVGTQIDSTSKQNIILGRDSSVKGGRIGSNKLNVKLTKRIQQNLQVGQIDRPNKLQKRGVLMFRN